MITSMDKPKILIVDDVPANITILQELLGDLYTIQIAIHGERALKLIATNPLPDLILLDIMMPGMDGYEVCARLKADPRSKTVPIIFVTALSDEGNEAKGLALGAVDYITKPFSPDLVKARIKNHLELKKYQDSLTEMVQEKTRQLKLTQEVTIESLGTLAEYRDNETGGHIKRTKRYTKILAESLKNHPHFKYELTDTIIELIHISSPLHDIGKVGIKDSILRKPGKLTTEEFEEMKKHTIYGRDALRVACDKLGDNSFLRYAQEIAYTHHEKWDGSGYPQGLKGNDIPLSGRIMALADVYDALISRRVYKKAFTHEETVHIITEGRGTHFDPELADAFLQLSLEFRKVADAHPDIDIQHLTIAAT